MSEQDDRDEELEGVGEEPGEEGESPEGAPHRGRRRKRKSQRKDRLIQTRVPEGLESVLKAEAHRRRLTVSHLIRNMIEDAFDLVDGVVEDVDQLVGDSMDLAFHVGEDAQKIAQIAKRSADRFRSKKPETDSETGAEAEAETGAEGDVGRRDESTEPSPGPRAGQGGVEQSAEAGAGAEAETGPSLDHVLAWNEVLLNLDARCARCDAPLAKGSVGFLGLSQDPSRPPAWLCPSCAAAL